MAVAGEREPDAFGGQKPGQCATWSEAGDEPLRQHDLGQLVLDAWAAAMREPSTKRRRRPEMRDPLGCDDGFGKVSRSSAGLFQVAENQLELEQ